MRAASIRVQVTVLATVVTALLLAITAISLIAIQRRQLTNNLDTALIQRADDLEAILGAGELPDSFGGTDVGVFAQLLKADGTVLVSSPSLEGRQPIGTDLVGVDGQIIQTVTGLDLDDDAFRVLSRPVDHTLGPLVLHVGASLDEVVDGVGALAASLLVAVPVVAALLAGLTWVVVGRTLAPVEAIRAEVAAIGGTQLTRRVPVPPTNDEIGRLALTMNEMLGRIETAAIRQRRFTADASHELRSPVTRIRTEAEVDLATPGTEHLRATIESIHAESVEMQQLLEDLLYLAAGDARTLEARSEPVDLDDMVFEELKKGDQGVAVDTSAVSAGPVAGDPRQLRRMVANLVDNAFRHARSAVLVSLAANETFVTLTIEDDGPGIPLARRDEIFERFTRLDESRTRNDGGAGLGLAIVLDIVERHGGTIAVADGPLGGARFTVRLPRID